ncbi:pathogenesis-related family 1 protein [Cocleimonas sp. KMM 6892]|uniref:pathogenesis-related family 1 protein n=1 Tax=unclassified Cocleimonas TaxID=2639732 RepID=UPI002DB70CC1|nr:MULTISPECIES: pathogenesis-related family 1 protein [unclassified Cocleimonas]MEB8433073.1 pathogenesis-related family 1 protein [Cocleimonas sp. KMM 6892]MEC4715946.1 pathogenesis-related family 1 protein [Cocleimonas sp. KMM 6895]MEC4745407.1 pathogenesis-related family 1 protein [Cocleimonas sp. KMM 6896]
MLKRFVILVASSVVLFACNTSEVKDSDAGSVASSKAKDMMSAPKRVNSEEFLAAHNRARAAEGVPALVWSEDLARYSKQWAEELNRTKSCDIVHRPGSGKFKQLYGENLYYASALNWSSGKKQIQNITSSKVVSDWVSEKANYNNKTNSCNAGEMCGHYTQVMWKNSTAVGCAVSVCDNKSQVWVCNYNPPGNYPGQRPF